MVFIDRFKILFDVKYKIKLYNNIYDNYDFIL